VLRGGGADPLHVGAAAAPREGAARRDLSPSMGAQTNIGSGVA
jgi:hypothetical protein